MNLSHQKTFHVCFSFACLPCIHIVFLFDGGAEDGIQSLVHAKHMLYCGPTSLAFTHT